MLRMYGNASRFRSGTIQPPYIFLTCQPLSSLFYATPKKSKSGLWIIQWIMWLKGKGPLALRRQMISKQNHENGETFGRAYFS